MKISLGPGRCLQVACFVQTKVQKLKKIILQQHKTEKSRKSSGLRGFNQTRFHFNNSLALPNPLVEKLQHETLQRVHKNYIYVKVTKPTGCSDHDSSQSGAKERIRVTLWSHKIHTERMSGWSAGSTKHWTLILFPVSYRQLTSVSSNHDEHHPLVCLSQTKPSENNVLTS